MRIRSRPVRIILILTAVAGLSLGLQTVAHASNTFPEVCAQNGFGYCMNAWGGGPQVNMYASGVANDGFSEVAIAKCNSAGTVTSTCPFGDHALDQDYLGFYTIRVQRNGTSLCVGAGSDDLGLEVACGDSHGNGIGTGGIMVKVPTGQGGFNLIDRYESDKVGQAEGAASSGYSGGPLVLYDGTLTDGAAQWGQITQV